MKVSVHSLRDKKYDLNQEFCNTKISNMSYALLFEVVFFAHLGIILDNVQLQIHMD